MEESILLFARAADIYRQERLTTKEAETVRDIAYVHNSLGRPDSAFFYYRRLLDLRARPGQQDRMGETLMLIGEVFHEQGLADSALRYYRRALPEVRTARDRVNEGRVLSDIGAIYQRMGQPDSALRYLGAAVVIRREVHDSLGEGVSLNNLALVHQTLGRADSAIIYLQQSLLRRRAVKDRGGEGTTLNNIAFSFEHLGRNDSALAYYRQALPLLEEAGKRSIVGVALANMGRVYLALGDTDSALSHLSRGLAIKREVGDRLGEGWALNDIGRVHQLRGRPDTAIGYFRQALERLRTAGDRAYQGEVLFNLAQTHHRGEMRPDLRLAVAYYDSAAAARSTVGSAAGGDANRLSFAEQDVRLYEEWALAWLGRGGEVGAEAAARASLAAAERGRAQALLHLLRGDRNRPAGRDSGADLVAEGDSLGQIMRRSGVASLSYLVTQDTLLGWLVLPSGEVLVSRIPIGRDSLAALVETLRSGLGVDDVSSSDIAFRSIGLLEEPVARGTGRRGLRYAESAAQTLGEILLPPELEDRLQSSTELVIVPQGSLTLLPFASLPLGRSRTALSEPFGAPHPARYAPSLAALREAEARPVVLDRGSKPGVLRRSLVVGDPTMPSITSYSGAAVRLASLPSARAEAKWVAARLGATPLTGGAATEWAVRRRLSDAPLIHLATHGYAFSSEARSRQSFVALAPGRGDDGVLSVGEVLDDTTLALDAELVVLSACQTGLGSLKEAEGTVGLQRAFLAKGARSVLVSLWSVSDAVTSLLMKRFYTHWLDDRDGPSKAEALRRAQQDIRATPGYEHPRFWVAFQLVGAG
jgi:CHAT domain-containing protein/tetratricopeptide (TPR) repeat protein